MTRRFTTAATRIEHALELAPATTPALARMLMLPASTAELAIRNLHRAGRVRPCGHTVHIPASRKRACAIRWARVTAAAPYVLTTQQKQVQP